MLQHRVLDACSDVLPARHMREGMSQRMGPGDKAPKRLRHARPDLLELVREELVKG